jgi:hypothetical protein
MASDTDRMSRGERLTLAQITRFTSNNLPEGWEVSIVFRNDVTEVQLRDRTGKQVDYVNNDNLSPSACVNGLVNHARRECGLDCAWLPYLAPVDSASVTKGRRR